MLDLPANQFINEMRQLSRAIGSMAKNLLLREQELQQLNISLETQVAERTKALHDANIELELLATTDALTGLLNRRRFDEKLYECFLALPRIGRHFAVLMLDVDHFKRINDVYGHPVGDRVLKEIAKVIAQNTRSTDTVARFGGEEFCVLLPAVTDKEEPMVVAEKIRTAIQAHTFENVGEITLSIGISFSAYNDAAAPEVIRRADEALYKAKAQGRNQTVKVAAAASLV
jgi:diguanylate cyclase (GGDEF)-like protein